MDGDDTTPEGFVSQESHDAAIADLNGQITSAQNQGSVFVNHDGSFKEGWQNHLGDGIEPDDPFFEKTRHLPSLVKSYKALESMQGSNVVKVPGEHTNEADTAIFKERMGIPDSADGYVFEKPQQMPEGLKDEDFDAPRLEAFKEIAGKLNLTREQFKGLVEADLNYYGQVALSDVDASKARQTEIEQDIQETLGDGGIKLSTKMANWVNQKLSTDPDNPVDIMADPTFGNSKLGMQVLALVAGEFGEDKLPRLDSEISNSGAAEMKEGIMNDPGNPKHKLYWAGDQKTVDEVARLTRLAMRGSSKS